MITEQLLKGYVDNSASMVNWTITLIGASFLVILNDGYYKPQRWKKYIYFGFFPAWISMAYSLKQSLGISNNYISIHFLNPKSKTYSDSVIDIGYTINCLYNNQIDSFYWACSIMALCFSTLVVLQIFDTPKPK